MNGSRFRKTGVALPESYQSLESLNKLRRREEDEDGGGKETRVITTSMVPVLGYSILIFHVLEILGLIVIFARRL